jgi:hypothetical protein
MAIKRRPEKEASRYRSIKSKHKATPCCSLSAPTIILWNVKTQGVVNSEFTHWLQCDEGSQSEEPKMQPEKELLVEPRAVKDIEFKVTDETDD